MIAPPTHDDDDPEELSELLGPVNKINVELARKLLVGKVLYQQNTKQNYNERHSL